MPCGWDSRCHIFCLCRRSELWADANGSASILFDARLSSFSARRSKGRGREQIERRGSAGKIFCGVEVQLKKIRVCDYAYAVVERKRDAGRVDGRLRSSVGTAPPRAPIAARGSAADSPGHVARLENVHFDGSGDRVAVDGRMQW